MPRGLRQRELCELMGWNYREVAQTAKQLSMKPGKENLIVIPTDLAAGSCEYYREPHRGAGMAGKLTIAS